MTEYIDDILEEVRLKIKESNKCKHDSLLRMYKWPNFIKYGGTCSSCKSDITFSKARYYIIVNQNYEVLKCGSAKSVDV